MGRRRWQQLWLRWVRRRIAPAPEVTLNNRRIFIAPSGVGLAFALALLLLLLAAINYQNSLAYGLTFLLASLFVVSILHTYRNLAGLQICAGACEAVYKDQLAWFHVHLQSSARPHYALGLGWSKDALQYESVPAQGRVELRLSQMAEQRGWLRPGLLRIESTFPLGLLRAWTWLDLEQQLLVYPKPQASEFTFSAGLGDESEQGHHSHGQGVDDFQGLRSYRPGDSKKRLHWKAYSKGQGLLVKDFSSAVGRDLSLDFSSLTGDLESRLSILCHWVLVLSEEQQSFSLRLPGVFLPANYGLVHRNACLQQLALFGIKQ